MNVEGHSDISELTKLVSKQSPHPNIDIGHPPFFAAITISEQIYTCVLFQLEVYINAEFIYFVSVIID